MNCRLIILSLLCAGALTAADAPLGKTVENWDSNGKPQHVFTWYKSGNRNIKHGWEVYYFETGGMARKYAWLKGKLNGPYQSWYPDGTLRDEGVYQDGKLNGPWLSQYPDGKPARKCEYVGGLVAGELTEWFANGRVRRKGRWTNGQPDGLFEEFREDGKPVLTANYAGGKAHGQTVRYGAGGHQALLLTYDQGILHGLVKRWDDKGNLLSEGEYRQGQPHDGVCWEEGDRPGEFYLYTYKAGQLTDAVLHEASGPFTGRIDEWHPDKVKARECDYIAGRKEGKERWYFPSGKLSSECTWKANKLVGTFTEWHPNGQKKSELNLVDGRLEGPAVIWDLRGGEIARGEYRNDQPWSGTLLFRPADGSEPYLQEYRDGRPVNFVDPLAAAGPRDPAAGSPWKISSKVIGPKSPDAGLADPAAQPEAPRHDPPPARP